MIRNVDLVAEMVERLEGRTLHHGETDYNCDAFCKRMEQDMTLVESVIEAVGCEEELEAYATENGLPLDEGMRKEYAFWLLDMSIMSLTQ